MKINGKFIYWYFGSCFLGKIFSLGFDYFENRKVNLNLKGKFFVFSDIVELVIM